MSNTRSNGTGSEKSGAISNGKNSAEIKSYSVDVPQGGGRPDRTVHVQVLKTEDSRGKNVSAEFVVDNKE